MLPAERGKAAGPGRAVSRAADRRDRPAARRRRALHRSHRRSRERGCRQHRALPARRPGRQALVQRLALAPRGRPGKLLRRHRRRARHHPAETGRGSGAERAVALRHAARQPAQHFLRDRRRRSPAALEPRPRNHHGAQRGRTRRLRRLAAAARNGARGRGTPRRNGLRSRRNAGGAAAPRPGAARNSAFLHRPPHRPRRARLRAGHRHRHQRTPDFGTPPAGQRTALPQPAHRHPEHRGAGLRRRPPRHFLEPRQRATLRLRAGRGPRPVAGRPDHPGSDAPDRRRPASPVDRTRHPDPLRRARPAAQERRQRPRLFEPRAHPQQPERPRDVLHRHRRAGGAPGAEPATARRPGLRRQRRSDPDHRRRQAHPRRQHGIHAHHRLRQGGNPRTRPRIPFVRLSRRRVLPADVARTARDGARSGTAARTAKPTRNGSASPPCATTAAR